MAWVFVGGESWWRITLEMKKFFSRTSSSRNQISLLFVHDVTQGRRTRETQGRLTGEQRRERRKSTNERRRRRGRKQKKRKDKKSWKEGPWWGPGAACGGAQRKGVILAGTACFKILAQRDLLSVQSIASQRQLPSSQSFSDHSPLASGPAASWTWHSEILPPVICEPRAGRKKKKKKREDDGATRKRTKEKEKEKEKGKEKEKQKVITFTLVGGQWGNSRRRDPLRGFFKSNSGLLAIQRSRLSRMITRPELIGRRLVEGTSSSKCRKNMREWRSRRKEERRSRKKEERMKKRREKREERREKKGRNGKAQAYECSPELAPSFRLLVNPLAHWVGSAPRDFTQKTRRSKGEEQGCQTWGGIRCRWFSLFSHAGVTLPKDFDTRRRKKMRRGKKKK